MTGLYVLTNIMGGRTDDPTPEQIAAYCKSFRDGTSALDKPAWDEAEHYARAGYTTVRRKHGFVVEAQEVGVRTYGEPRPGHFEPANSEPPEPVWREADFERANKTSKGTGARERTAAWAFDINLGE